MRLSDLFPHRNWWFNMADYYEGRPKWEGFLRQHVPAHVLAGIVYYGMWHFIEVGHPWLAALFFAVLWEAHQRELHRNFPWVENVWDVILSVVGIGICAAIL